MNSHDRFIHHGDWQTLIIIDACRWDEFTAVYSKMANNDWLSGYDHFPTPMDNGGCVNTEHWYWRHLDRPLPDYGLISTHPIGWSLRSKVNGQLMHERFGYSLPLWQSDTFPSPREALAEASTYRGNKKLMIHLVPPYSLD